MPPKKTMTANPARPKRYRAGKVIAEVTSSEEDNSDLEEEEQEETQTRRPPPKATSFPARQAGTVLKDVDLAERRKQAALAEKRRLAAEQQKREKEEREAGFVTESESEAGSEEDEESGSSDQSGSEESSAEEEDSSEDEPKRVLLRPIFIPKHKRNLDNSAAATAEREDERLAEEEARRKEVAESHVRDQIEKANAARAAGKKNWDDDEEDEEGAVDDTDGLNPELEHKSWVARELTRIKRAREAMEEREHEIAEQERRNGLTAAEREAEDRAHVAKQEEEKAGRGQMGHMQRYHHRGAFFADESEKAGLLNRDLMGARFEDQPTAREAMPEYLQVRDATKIGKKGRTRYKDMKSEDTGRFGDHLKDDRRPFKGGSGFNDVTDERFRPDSFRSGEGATGANAGPLGERKRTYQRADDSDSKRARYD